MKHPCNRYAESNFLLLLAIAVLCLPITALGDDTTVIVYNGDPNGNIVACTDAEGEHAIATGGIAWCKASDLTAFPLGMAGAAPGQLDITPAGDFTLSVDGPFGARTLLGALESNIVIDPGSKKYYVYVHMVQSP